MSSTLPVFSTHQINNVLADHCGVETPLIRAQSKALVATTGNPSLNRPALAECLPIYQKRAEASQRKLQQQEAALGRLSAQIGRLNEKIDLPTSGPGRDWALTALRQKHQTQANLLEQSKLGLEGLNFSIAAAGVQQARLLETHGGMSSVELHPHTAEMLGIQAQGPNPTMNYYNEKILFDLKQLKQIDAKVAHTRDQLKVAQQEHAQAPNATTQEAVEAMGAEHNKNIDERSYLWMQVNWLAGLRDQSALQTSSWERLLSIFKPVQPLPNQKVKPDPFSAAP